MEKDTQYSHFTKNADFTELKIRLEKDSRKKNKKLVPGFQRWTILFLRKKPCSHVKLRLFPGYRILVSGRVNSLDFWLIT